MGNKMKLALVVLSAAGAQAWVTPQVSTRASTSLNAAGIYFATSTGNTEVISEYLADATGLEAPEVCAEADALIVGAPTWNTGADEQRSGTDWDDWLEDTLPNCDVTGKKVA